MALALRELWHNIVKASFSFLLHYKLTKILKSIIKEMGLERYPIWVADTSAKHGHVLQDIGVLCHWTQVLW